MSDKTSEINRLIDIVDLLRSENGCPWDKEQTSESLIPFFIEEVYEAVECIEQNNNDIKEELGDLLFTFICLARHLDISIDDILLDANSKFKDRFEKII